MYNLDTCAFHQVIRDHGSVLQVSSGQKMVRVVERVREERRSEFSVISWKDWQYRAVWWWVLESGSVTKGLMSGCLIRSADMRVFGLIRKLECVYLSTSEYMDGIRVPFYLFGNIIYCIWRHFVLQILGWNTINVGFYLHFVTRFSSLSLFKKKEL